MNTKKWSIIALSSISILIISVLCVSLITKNTIKDHFTLNSNFSNSEDFSLNEAVNIDITVRETVPKEKKQSSIIAAKHINYDIGVTAKESNKKFASANLEFDLFYSPEKGQAEIKNDSMKVTYSAKPWNVKCNLHATAGNGTDLPSIEYSLYALAENDSVIYSDNFTITADKNGNTEIFLPKNIKLDMQSYDKYSNDFLRKKNAAGMTYQKTIDALYPVKLTFDNTLEYFQSEKVSFQVKGHESIPQLLVATNNLGKSVPDLYEKEIIYEFFLQSPKEPFGTMKINATTTYSQTEGYSSFSAGIDQSSGFDAWEFSCTEVGKTGNKTSLVITTYEIVIKDDGATYDSFFLTLTSDSNGNTTLKPVYELSLS